MSTSLKLLETGRIVPGCENTPELREAHLKVTGGKPYFRFPPEPNGFLHIGHAKSMKLNFGEALANGGVCYLRYDDTNPETEEQLYIDAIEEMVRWMGWEPWKVTFSSDYFPQLYEFAIRLIHKGRAYVDHSTADEIKKQREAHQESPWRNRPIDENLRLFEYMRQGRYAEGEATLRLKMDVTSNNPNMYDIIAYRIKYSPHPHVGDKWCVYPSYDYTHCIVDSLEDIDYSCCTLEFETRRESYFWLIAELELYRPYVWEFSRLNVTGSLLSKRKINKLVERKIVRGFDDPRLLTLAGMRRRGYTPRAINKFCELIGLTRAQNVIDIKMLENCLREDLDEHVERRLGVMNPVRVIIENWKGERSCSAPNHPAKPDRGSREIMFSDELWIDGSDFREVDENPKQYYGLAPGKTVGLKYCGNITCKSFTKDAAGNITVLCDIDFERAIKPKTNISWVSARHCAAVEIRTYEPLLKDNSDPDNADFMQAINRDSEHIVAGYVEADLMSKPPFYSVQFERFGYFTVDTDTNVASRKLVMNRVIGLKEDKEKPK